MHIRAQMQSIVDRLVGTPFENMSFTLPVDEPWRTIYARVTRADDRTEAERLIWKATEHLGDLEVRRQWTRHLVALLPDDDQFNPFSSLHDMSARMREVEWLWPSWIPRGMVTLLGAAPGAGKSLVALDLTRRIIHDEPFPDGTPVPCPGSNVLIVDAEGAPTLLNQRARAWDIDSRRLFLMVAPRASSLIELDDHRQQLQLVEMCRKLKPSLVVVDSLAAATARGETSLQGARTTFGFLSTLAGGMNPALLVIHHLRKHAGFNAASSHRIVAGDLRGSSHLSATARSVLALSWVAAPSAAPFAPSADPAPAEPVLADSAASTIPAPRAQTAFDGPRRLEVVKTNLCRHPPPLGLIFEGQGAPVPVLRYTELVEPLPEPTHVDLCARWLFQYLADAAEPVKPASLILAASEAGFHERTLYRARQALAGWVVDLGTSPHDPRKRWVLAAAPAPPQARRLQVGDPERSERKRPGR